jgi:hypothetical protein
VIATLLLLAALLDDAPPPPVRRNPRPLLVVMNEVVDRLGPRLLAPPAPESRRLSVKNGLVGLGAYDARGGEAPLGFAAPPLHVFPRAGFGNSLNLDPVTGRPGN